jgi:hypothetical protein
VAVVCVRNAPNCCNILISGKIIKEMSGSVGEGHSVFCAQTSMFSVLSSYVVSFWVRCLLYKKKEGETWMFGHKT